MAEITTEQLAIEKEKIESALSAMSLDEAAINHTLKGYRKDSMINAVFLVLSLISVFSYPLITVVNPFQYVAFWAMFISIFVMRVKLYLKITPKEMELVGLMNLRLLYETELAKILQYENDRLTGQRGTEEPGTTIQGPGESTLRSGEDSRSSETESSSDSTETRSDEGGGIPASEDAL
jgi:hypothetical protein